MKGKQLAKDMGFVGVEELQANADNYRERLRDFDKVKKEGKILVQYGIPSAFKPGSYDRYSSLEMYPDVEYFLMISSGYSIFPFDLDIFSSPDKIQPCPYILFGGRILAASKKAGQ